MRKFFARNLDSRGRWIRGIGGALLLIGGAATCRHIAWAGVALMIAGAFMIFEALRGWCLMRACGIKTRL